MVDLSIPARIAVKDCLRVKQGEKVLVITDRKKRKIGNAIFIEAIKSSKNSELIEIPVGKVNGEEPSSKVAALMKDSDVVIAPTDKSLTHTNATRAAMKKGARVATLPGIKEDTFVRLMSANYRNIDKVAKKLIKKLSGAKNVEITTPSGTSLKFSIAGKKFGKDTGLIESGEVGNLPAGEICTAPVEGTAEGTLIIDNLRDGKKIFAPSGTKIEIENGEAISISKDCELKDNFANIKNSKVVAELGIGLNEKAKLAGSILEDEKVKGTIHIAFGDNTSYGGSNYSELHMDTICEKPTVFIDGWRFMTNGEFMI